MFTLIALLSMAIGASAVGVPTDAAVYTFTEGVPDDNLDVVGRVLKFMDPTRAADPKEILRQLGVPPKPAPAAEAGRVLQAMETYEPTTVTYAPTTVTYEPTTETYAPTTAGAVVTYPIDVAAASRDAVVAAIPGYTQMFASLAGVPTSQVTVTVSQNPVTRRRLEAAELAAGARSLQATLTFLVTAIYSIPVADAQNIADALETKDVPQIQQAIDEAYADGAFGPVGDPGTPAKPVVTEVEDVKVDTNVPADSPTPVVETLPPTIMPSPLPSPVPTKAPVSVP